MLVLVLERGMLALVLERDMLVLVLERVLASVMVCELASAFQMWGKMLARQLGLGSVHEWVFALVHV